MDRLTKIDGIGQNEIIKCFECGLEKAGAELEHCGYCEHWQAVLDRLAAYEDTGLEPEDIKKAFNEEAVLKLAAQALGTTPDRLRELVKAQDEGLLLEMPCKPGTELFGHCDIRGANPISRGYFRPPHIPKLGVDAWLTRAEAEAALGGGGDG